MGEALWTGGNPRRDPVMRGKASTKGRGMGNVSDKGPNIVISFSIAGSGAESERRKSAKNKWKPVIMIRVKWPPPPYQKVEVLNNIPLACPSPTENEKGWAFSSHTRAFDPPHGGIAPSLSLCFSFLVNPSIVPVRLNFLVALFQFDPVPPPFP
jgi:hypothetical protein